MTHCLKIGRLKKHSPPFNSRQICSDETKHSSVQFSNQNPNSEKHLGWNIRWKTVLSYFPSSLQSARSIITCSQCTYLASTYSHILSSNNIYAQIRERTIFVQTAYIYSNIFLHHLKKKRKKKKRRGKKPSKWSLSISQIAASVNTVFFLSVQTRGRKEQMQVIDKYLENKGSWYFSTLLASCPPSRPSHKNHIYFFLLVIT